MFADPHFCFTILAQGQPAAAGDAPFNIPLWPFMIAILVMAYFMLIRPQQRQKAEMMKSLDALKKNDRIVTIGGIYGTVVNVGKNTDEITIRIDEGTSAKMRIQRSAVKAILGDEKATSEETVESK